MNPDDVNIDPNVTSGTELANIINRQTAAHISIHMGTTRPAYATLGTWWADETDPTNIPVYLFDGNADILVWRIKPDTNIVELALQIGVVTISDTAPTNPVVGMLWYNLLDNSFNLWEGTTWIQLNVTTEFSDTPPSVNNFVEWVDTSTLKRLVSYDNGSENIWVEI